MKHLPLAIAALLVLPTGAQAATTPSSAPAAVATAPAAPPAPGCVSSLSGPAAYDAGPHHHYGVYDPIAASEPVPLYVSGAADYFDSSSQSSSPSHSSYGASTPSSPYAFSDTGSVGSL